MPNFPPHRFEDALQSYSSRYKATYNEITDSEKSNICRDIAFDRGKKFIRVVTVDRNLSGAEVARSAHAFICIQAHGKFNFGDILKPASWQSPAKNFARGNVLRPETYANHSVFGL